MMNNKLRILTFDDIGMEWSNFPDERQFNWNGNKEFLDIDSLLKCYKEDSTKCASQVIKMIRGFLENE